MVCRGLAGWDGRTVRVDLSLLPEGTYAVELFRDGENAARIAQDYVREEFLLAPGKSFDVKMFPGRRFRRPDNQTIAYGHAT